MAEGGWLGITMPTEHGGSGLGVTEAAIMMNEVATHGGAMAAVSSVHINLFGPHPIIVYGTPEQKRRIFDRFYRAEPSGKLRGSGLGMCLVKEIMDIMGGRVEVESALGEGSTCTLWLRVVTPPAQAGAER